MNASEILSDIDGLLKESRLDEAKKYMTDTLAAAQRENRSDIMLTVLGELAGFYRDCGDFASSLDCCRRSEELMEKMGITGSEQYISALLNSANACRAAGLREESLKYYGKIRSELEAGHGNDVLYASYYNNLALLYQDAGDFGMAARCLESALSLTSEGESRRAITRTNLAVCLVKTGDIARAREILAPAMKFFTGMSPSDFHYSAALAAMGDICFAEENFTSAAEHYEAALSEIELHMGRNNFFDIVSENLSAAYERLGGKPHLSGMELCERYFNAFGRPMLKRNFSGYLDSIACGLAGEGSECLGFDDNLSADHDYGPSFCIWTDLPDDICQSLQKAYDLLPKTYMGMKRLETPTGKGRTGVVKTSDFLKKFTGFDHVPAGSEEWQYTSDELLACAVNGRVFMENSGEFSDMRRRLLVGEPEDIRLRKLAAELEKMAQSGQYNYPRAIKRGDKAAAHFALSAFMESAMKAAHILSRKYAPYSKWLLRSTAEMPRFDGLAREIENTASGKDISESIENACRIIRTELKNQLICHTEEAYLAVCADEVKSFADAVYIAEEIISMEWAFFDKVENMGGRADCQDDWETFSIMRRSQYYTWPCALLYSLREDFRTSAEEGRNPITEKYGYMMESTVPDEFERIKGMLPPVPDEKRKLCDAICEIQVGWMEDFAQKYPKLAARSRAIHTYEDTPFLTSYETYLRGELFTYSDVTLKMYGSFIVSLYSEGKNLACEIMNRSVHMYGFDSLEAAEERE